MRASVSVRRSMNARVRPFVRARSRSARLASSSAALFSSSACAIWASASSFTRVPQTASACAATRAARAFDSTSCLTSMLYLYQGGATAAPPRHPPTGLRVPLMTLDCRRVTNSRPSLSQNHEIVAVDDFVEALVTETRGDVTGLGAANATQLAGIEVDEPARELPALSHQRHHLARREVALDVHDARGQQALSMMS